MKKIDFNSILKKIKDEYECGNKTKAIELLRKEPIGLSREYTHSFFNQLLLIATEWISNAPTLEAYFIRASAYFHLGDFDYANQDVERVLELNPNYAYAYSLRAYIDFRKANFTKSIAGFHHALKLEPNYITAYNGLSKAYAKMAKYKEAFEFYNKALEIDPTYHFTYFNRGELYLELGQYKNAIIDFTKVIELVPSDISAYNGRGNAYHYLELYENAINDYTKIIEIEPKNKLAYLNRGGSYYSAGEYGKAIKDFTKAIELDPYSFKAYKYRGDSYQLIRENKKALKDYNKAIELKKDNPLAYYNRAIVYSKLDNFKKAILDFQMFLTTYKGEVDYLIQYAKSQIKELEKRLEDADYSAINELISKVKMLLQVDEDCLTHYTSLSVAKLLILEKNLFRLSEGSYLNDTSEGRELFNYLEFHQSNYKINEPVPETFAEKPFIGSFVSQAKHDDLTLWRMYGKEAQTEAKGCAITINREHFLTFLRNKLNPEHQKTESPNTTTYLFTFYRVAYRLKEESENPFIIPGGQKNDEIELNNCMRELLKKIQKMKSQKLTTDKEHQIKELLNDIAYLFKSSEYLYENEVRLVVSGVGFEKYVSADFMPPKVYIELINIIPAITRITLGPKVDRPDEWASAFNYSIKNAGHKSEIVISHLPFK